MTQPPEPSPSTPGRLDLPPPDAYRRDAGALAPSRSPRSAPLRWGGLSPSAVLPAAPRAGAWRLGDGFGRNTVFVGFALALALFVLVQVVAVLIIGEDADEPTELWAGLLATLIFDAAVAFGVIVLVLGGPRRALATLALRLPRGRDVGWGFAGLALAWLVLGAYIGIVDLISVDELEPVSTISEDELFERVGLVALTGVLVVLVAPVAEEIIFRGFLLGGLARRFGPVLAALASSLLFAAVHADLGSLIPFTLIGLVFTFVYLRSGSLSSAILAHFLFNVIGYAGTLADRGVG